MFTVVICGEGKQILTKNTNRTFHWMVENFQWLLQLHESLSLIDKYVYLLGITQWIEDEISNDQRLQRQLFSFSCQIKNLGPPCFSLLRVDGGANWNFFALRKTLWTSTDVLTLLELKQNWGVSILFQRLNEELQLCLVITNL